VDCTAGGDASCVVADVGGCCGFACHRNWRLPERRHGLSYDEFEGVIDLTQGACGGGSGACIDPIFGPTTASFYWSATEDDINPGFALGVHFGNGGFFTGIESLDEYVRAVRMDP